MAVLLLASIIALHFLFLSLVFVQSTINSRYLSVNKQREGSEDKRRIVKQRRHIRLRLFRSLLQARAVTLGQVKSTNSSCFSFQRTQTFHRSTDETMNELGRDLFQIVKESLNGIRHGDDCLRRIGKFHYSINRTVNKNDH